MTTTDAPAAPAVQGFDYSALPRDVAAEAREVAQRIVASQEQHIALAVQAGRELASIKGRLDHGHWLPWLELECRIDKRTAQRYMATAEAFGEKYDTVSYLPMSTVYKLASPKAEPIKAAIVTKIEAGERPTAKDVESEIWRAQQDQKRKAEPAQVRKARIEKERKTAIRHAKVDLAEHEERAKVKTERRAMAEKLAALLLAGLTEPELRELRASFELLGGQSGAEYLGRAILETLHPWLKEERERWESQSLSLVQQRLERALAA